MKTSIRTGLAALACAAFAWLPTAHADAWKPTHPVEFAVGAGAGGALDQVARMLQKITGEQHSVPTPIVVMNKPAGGGLVAVGTLKQHPGDAEYLASWSQQWLTNYITGEWKESPTTGYTTLAILFNEYVGLAVRADSPLKTAGDLIAKLRKDPTSESIAIATAIGNHIHIGAAKPLLAAGVDVSKLTSVPFKSSAQSITSLLGGHVDVVAATTANLVGQLQAGKIRLLAISSPKRLGGVFANVPTWKEQGVDAEFASMQGIMAPPHLTPAQHAYWTETLERATASPEWKAFCERNQWTPHLVTGPAAQKLAEEQLVEMRNILRTLKLAKQ